MEISIVVNKDVNTQETCNFTYIIIYPRVMRFKFKIHGSIIARPSETMKFEIISGVDC